MGSWPVPMMELGDVLFSPNPSGSTLEPSPLPYPFLDLIRA